MNKQSTSWLTFVTDLMNAFVSDREENPCSRVTKDYGHASEMRKF